MFDNGPVLRPEASGPWANMSTLWLPLYFYWLTARLTLESKIPLLYIFLTSPHLSFRRNSRDSFSLPLVDLRCSSIAFPKLTITCYQRSIYNISCILWTITKGLEKRVEEMATRGRIKAIHRNTWLSSARILWRVLETRIELVVTLTPLKDFFSSHLCEKTTGSKKIVAVVV